MRLQYVGESAGAVPGWPAWQPGEVRDVGPEEAALQQEEADARGEIAPVPVAEEVA